MGTIYEIKESGAIISPNDAATDYIKRSRATQYIASNIAATSIASAGVWQAINGIPSPIINQIDFIGFTNFSMQYVGAKKMTFSFKGNASITSAISGGSLIGLGLSAQGSSTPVIPSANYAVVNSPRGALPFAGSVILDPGDFIKLLIYSSVVGNVTITDAVLDIVSV